MLQLQQHCDTCWSLWKERKTFFSSILFMELMMLSMIGILKVPELVNLLLNTRMFFEFFMLNQREMVMLVKD